VSHTAQHKGLIISGGLLAMFLIEALVLLATEGSQSRRREHFWLRFLAAIATLPVAVLALTEGGRTGLLSARAAATLSPLFVFVCIPALMLLPGILFETRGPSSEGDDDGGGGNGGPPQTPPPRDQPRGDLPLPDAGPGRWRLRDHVAPRRDRGSGRRPAREPDRRPVPLGPIGPHR
jgi:hypothetical protein